MPLSIYCLPRLRSLRPWMEEAKRAVGFCWHGLSLSSCMQIHENCFYFFTFQFASVRLWCMAFEFPCDFNHRLQLPITQLSLQTQVNRYHCTWRMFHGLVFSLFFCSWRTTATCQDQLSAAVCLLRGGWRIDRQHAGRIGLACSGMILKSLNIQEWCANNLYQNSGIVHIMEVRLDDMHRPYTSTCEQLPSMLSSVQWGFQLLTSHAPPWTHAPVYRNCSICPIYIYMYKYIYV